MPRRAIFLTLALAACGSVVSTPDPASTSTSTSTSTGPGGAASTSASTAGTTTSSTATSGAATSGAATGTSTGTGMSVCVPGQDQFCNDDPSVSAIWGKCAADGTCLCNPGFEVNPATGRCRPAGSCGDTICKANEFCLERVHSQDAGPVPSTWMCQVYFTCTEHTCACALMNFVSASCISPICVSASPVMIQCQDLN